MSFKPDAVRFQVKMYRAKNRPFNPVARSLVMTVGKPPLILVLASSEG